MGGDGWAATQKDHSPAAVLDACLASDAEDGDDDDEEDSADDGGGADADDDAGVNARAGVHRPASARRRCRRRPHRLRP